MAVRLGGFSRELWCKESQASMYEKQSHCLGDFFRVKLMVKHRIHLPLFRGKEVSTPKALSLADELWEWFEVWETNKNSWGLWREWS